ncbi:N-6 DNA methylase [Sinorhizobium meliloti]|nr:N-6 DNA methylase [Sinorhizobium meliloti]
MAKRTESRVSFAAIRIEGSLILPDILAKVAAGTAPEQGDSNYGILPGLKLRDEIPRFWNVGRALWKRFDDGRAGTNPTVVTAAFARDLLTKVLGLDLDDATPSKSGLQNLTAKNGSVPMVVSADAPVDQTRSIAMSSGKPIRKTASAWLQAELNANSRALWGIATDGMRLRLLRDNDSLTRPALIEVDLDKIFRESLHDEFTVFWLLCHHTRFGFGDGNPDDCPLERWRGLGQSEGVTARGRLRDGVEKALFHLGTGFLEHPANSAVRDRLLTSAVANGQENDLSEGRPANVSSRLTVQDFHKQLLRLVYRLIFLMTAEDRNVLLDPAAGKDASTLFQRGYSTDRLRERSRVRAAWDRHADAYQGIRILIRAAAFGEPRLGIPALGGIFAVDQCPDIETLPIFNHRFLQALYHLSWMEHAKSLVRINWRDMETEELGSVYESLLELTPAITENASRFYFVKGEGDVSTNRREAAQDNSRKLTGSYYTPDPLVQLLLDQALEPLIERKIAENPTDPEVLLTLDVIDPACGSGHFLLGAARRIANTLAELRTSGSATEIDYRHAMRDVIARCIYGVDRNAFAVELCRLALWLESVETGRPLGFLSNRILHGDSLVGVRNPEMLRRGVPEAAFEALTDADDKTVSSEIKRWNRELRTGKAATGMLAEYSIPEEIVTAAEELLAMPAETLEDIVAQQTAFNDLVKQDSWKRFKLSGDAYVSAFFVPKVGPVSVRDTNGIPTTDTVWSALREGTPAPTFSNIAKQRASFDWYLAFPQVFEKGGFDLVLGNPPWETMSPDAKEFYSKYDGGVRFLAKDEQAARINELLSLPGVQQEWDAYCRDLYVSANFFKKSGRYMLFAEGNLGKGDFNVYRMFVELALQIVKPGGRAAQFVPENLYNGANAAAIRAHLFDSCELLTLVGFENTGGIWFETDTRLKFCLYVAVPGGRTESFSAAFGVNSHEKLASLKEGLPIEIPVALVREFSPEAQAVAEVAHRSDIEIARKLYTRYPRFGEVVDGLPTRQYAAELHMGNDRDDFEGSARGLPVFEGRMVEAFDYRAKAYVSGRGRAAVWRPLPFGAEGKEILPQWRIAQDAIPQKIGDRWTRYRLGFCDVASPTNQRAFVAALIPPMVVCGDKVPTLELSDRRPESHLLLLGVINSICMDFLVRKKISLKMAFNIVDSLPLPRSFGRGSVEMAIAQRALLLAAAGSEMADFWRSSADLVGLDVKRFSPETDPAKRRKLATELDVLVARDLFGLSKTDMTYLLDPSEVLGADCGFETFGALKRAEVREFGRFETRDAILSRWDELATGEAATPNAADLDHAQLLNVSALNTRSGPSVGAGGWATPHGNRQVQTLAQLGALVRVLAGPVDRAIATRAALFSLEPRLLTPHLSAERRDEWLRLVGSEAEPRTGVTTLGLGSAAGWAEAKATLLATGSLVEDTKARTWIPGVGLENYPIDTWSGRARFALDEALRLASTNTEMSIDETEALKRIAAV